jgi:hypothetical protein
MQIPLVPMEATRDYYKNSWHMGCGVKPLLDETTLKFATEWANVVLKQASGLCYQYAKAQLLAEIRQVKAEKAAQGAGCPPSKMQGDIAPQAIQKSSIILTD